MYLTLTYGLSLMTIKSLTADNLDIEMNNISGLMIVRFTASWCGPCKTFEPVFKELAKRNDSVHFFEVDIDKEPHLSAHFEVRGVPATFFCNAKTREIIHFVSGVKPLYELQEILDDINSTLV